MNPKPSLILNPADFRPPPNGDRVALTETGREWVAWVEGGFVQLCTAINRNTAQIDQLAAGHRELSNNVMRALSERPPPMRTRQDSWSEITGVQNLDAAKDVARDFRERLQDQRERAERAEAELAKARADDQLQIEALRADNRNLLKWFRVILVTFIVALVGGGGAVLARGGFSSPPQSQPYEPHWTPGP